MLTVLDYLEIRKAHAAGESIRSIAGRLTDIAAHCWERNDHCGLLGDRRWEFDLGKLNSEHPL
jgi:hypothetical protein